MAHEQRIVLFDGRVQGVGFRYTACRAAEGYRVTGTVRNLPDGRVECVLEGETGEIDGFLGDLGRRMDGYIRDRRETKAPPTGQFPDFDVRY